MIKSEQTYDYNKAFNWIEGQGKMMYGKNFALNQSDLPVLYKLLSYYLKDEKNGK
jgi:hypothetical protein